MKLHTWKRLKWIASMVQVKDNTRNSTPYNYYSNFSAIGPKHTLATPDTFLDTEEREDLFGAGDLGGP